MTRLKRMVTTDNKGRAWKTVGSALVVGCGGAGGLAERLTSPDHGQVEHLNVVDSAGNIWMVRWGFYGQVRHKNHFNMIRDCI